MYVIYYNGILISMLVDHFLDNGISHFVTFFSGRRGTSSKGCLEGELVGFLVRALVICLLVGRANVGALVVGFVVGALVVSFDVGLDENIQMAFFRAKINFHVSS